MRKLLSLLTSVLLLASVTSHAQEAMKMVAYFPTPYASYSTIQVNQVDIGKEKIASKIQGGNFDIATFDIKKTLTNQNGSALNAESVSVIEGATTSGGVITVSGETRLKRALESAGSTSGTSSHFVNTVSLGGRTFPYAKAVDSSATQLEWKSINYIPAGKAANETKKFLIIKGLSIYPVFSCVQNLAVIGECNKLSSSDTQGMYNNCNLVNKKYLGGDTVFHAAVSKDRCQQGGGYDNDEYYSYNNAGVDLTYPNCASGKTNEEICGLQGAGYKCIKSLTLPSTCASQYRLKDLVSCDTDYYDFTYNMCNPVKGTASILTCSSTACTSCPTGQTLTSNNICCTTGQGSYLNSSGVAVCGTAPAAGCPSGQAKTAHDICCPSGTGSSFVADGVVSCDSCPSGSVSFGVTPGSMVQSCCPTANAIKLADGSAICGSCPSGLVRSPIPASPLGLCCAAGQAVVAVPGGAYACSSKPEVTISIASPSLVGGGPGRLSVTVYASKAVTTAITVNVNYGGACWNTDNDPWSPRLSKQENCFDEYYDFTIPKGQSSVTKIITPAPSWGGSNGAFDSIADISWRSFISGPSAPPSYEPEDSNYKYVLNDSRNGYTSSL